MNLSGSRPRNFNYNSPTSIFRLDDFMGYNHLAPTPNVMPLTGLSPLIHAGGGVYYWSTFGTECFIEVAANLPEWDVRNFSDGGGNIAKLWIDVDIDKEGVDSELLSREEVIITNSMTHSKLIPHNVGFTPTLHADWIGSTSDGLGFDPAYYRGITMQFYLHTTARGVGEEYIAHFPTSVGGNVIRTLELQWRYYYDWEYYTARICDISYPTIDVRTRKRVDKLGIQDDVLVEDFWDGSSGWDGTRLDSSNYGGKTIHVIDYDPSGTIDQYYATWENGGRISAYGMCAIH